jgi:hypothetical protein
LEPAFVGSNPPAPAKLLPISDCQLPIDITNKSSIGNRQLAIGNDLIL